jgi:hypothetical protein
LITRSHISRLKNEKSRLLMMIHASDRHDHVRREPRQRTVGPGGRCLARRLGCRPVNGGLSHVRLPLLRIHLDARTLTNNKFGLEPIQLAAPGPFAHRRGT